MSRTRPAIVQSFFRAQASSLAATAVDFGSLVLLVEAFAVWYVAATALGAFAGAVTNFLLNRHWSFEAGHFQATPQAFKYALVSGGSLCLNTAGVYAVTEWAGSPYPVSKVLTALGVGILYNFPLHRSFVFRGKQEPHDIPA